MSWSNTLLSIFAGTSSLSAVYLWRRLKNYRRPSTAPQTHPVTANPLAMEILEAHRRNQRRMSSDLHDGVSQNLAGISLLLESLAQQLQKESPGTAVKLDRIADLVQSTSSMAEDRVLNHKMQHEPAAVNGLTAALEDLAENIETFFSVEGKVVEEMSHSVAGSLAGHLYKIAEEAAYNAIRHGQPSQVRFELRDDAGHAILQIDDDGCGITDVRDPKGRGLQLMALRCKKIDATLEVKPKNIGGTRVICRWPTGPRVT